MTNASNRKPLLAILDGHGIIHRAYYALKDQPLVARRTGENTSAVFGFTNTLLTIIDDLKPTHLAVAVDLPGPTFRHVRDATYKATRFENVKTQVISTLATVPGIDEKLRTGIAELVAGAESRDQIKQGVYDTADDAGISADLRLDIERALSPIESSWDLGRQMGRCLEMMEAFNIPVFSAQGFEADDVIGTLAKQAAEQGIDTYLVTLDSDFIQLIEPGVQIYMMRPTSATMSSTTKRLRAPSTASRRSAWRTTRPCAATAQTTSPASPASATAPRRSCSQLTTASRRYTRTSKR